MATNQKESDIDVFARVLDDKIIEFPVLRSHIVARGHPITMYVPVVDSPVEIPDFHYDIESPFYENGVVRINHEILPYSLQDMLSQIYAASFGADMLTSVPVYAKDVRAGTLDYVISLVDALYEAKLDAFAKERGYNSLNNLLSRYSNSSNSSFKADAEHAQSVLDSTWEKLAALLETVSSGASPVPRSVSEIEAYVGELLWV